MNIVIVTNYLPYPLNSGGAQAQYNMIDKLRKNHKISLIFTQESRNKLSAMRHLKSIWPEVDFYPFLYIRQILYFRFVLDKAVRAFGIMFRGNSTRFFVERTLKPYGMYFSQDFIKFVNKIVKQANADIVQAEFFPCLELAKFLPDNVKKVFVHHELRFIRNERLLSAINLSSKEKQTLYDVKTKEIADLNRYDEIITLTQVDKETIEKAGVTSHISVSPAAVNAKICEYQEWNGKVCFLGGYDHIPNREGVEWFLNEVGNCMDAQIHIDFHLIGKGWPSDLPGKGNMTVTVHGFVENLFEAISGSIMIVPILTGSGMRMKILEASAMSLPILTTSVGVEGLDFLNEQACLVADTPDAFAFQLKRLIKDGKLRALLAKNANKTFCDKYSVEALADVRESVYQRLMK